MFTGIIETRGKVESLQVLSGDWRLKISLTQFKFNDVKLGDSISVSGVCLTVIDFAQDWFTADVSNETIACTAMADLVQGELVNLERAMQPTSRLGGHIVSGHVDGVAVLIGKEVDARSACLRYRVPPELAKYIAQKGSVCLDGVSLTVNEVDGDEFSVNIIPHTATETTIEKYQLGRKVNLEVDVISRYLERLLQSRSGPNESALTIDVLNNAGFIK